MLHTAIHTPVLSLRNLALYFALLISMVLHTAILFGFAPAQNEPTLRKITKSMDVVLVNSRSVFKPLDAERLAQTNLDGGGNVDKDRHAKTPFPVIPQAKPQEALTVVEQKTARLEAETRKLLAAASSTPQITQPAPDAQVSENLPPKPLDKADLLQRSREIAQLEAEIAREHQAYQKRPKRRFIGARTREYRFARYLEDWRLKVERIGNLNYPEAARREKLYGSLQLTVGIRADGSLESIGIDRSSNMPVLDEAAVNIVRLAARNGFAPFPEDIRRDTDILHITRTWVFARSDKLFSE
ncbi:MAG: TonB family protein [Nitrosomonas sp.]|nr:TonB family protein [Nitrosomonas sp.]